MYSLARLIRCRGVLPIQKRCRVYGESTASSGGYGVAGHANAPNGIGVWGKSAGWSFYSDGDAHQTRDGGGWVKAMVYADALNHPYRIVRCFNSALSGPAARTPPCGIVFTEVSVGIWLFDFGFRVNDRFYSATFANRTAINSAMVIEAIDAPGNPNAVRVWTTGGDYTDGKQAIFQLIVY